MKTNWLQQNQNKKIAICIAFLVGFILFSIFRTNFQTIDNTVNLWTATIHTDTATLLAKGIHYTFNTIIIAATTIIIAGFLFIKGHKTKSLLFLSAIGGNALLVTAIKTITQIARPENQIIHDTSFSYPSGHCTNAIVFVGLITYYAWLKWNSNQHTKIFSLTIFSLIITLVSFDRIYLNIHWLSDIIGGCLFGAFWLTLCIITYEPLKLSEEAKITT
jgi:membrane-associated phospholipid phosphatase